MSMSKRRNSPFVNSVALRARPPAVDKSTMTPGELIRSPENDPTYSTWYRGYLRWSMGEISALAGGGISFEAARRQAGKWQYGTNCTKMPVGQIREDCRTTRPTTERPRVGRGEHERLTLGKTHRKILMCRLHHDHAKRRIGQKWS